MARRTKVASDEPLTQHEWSSFAHDGGLVTAACGCVGREIARFSKHGGSVHVKVTIPCRGGSLQHVERVAAGVIVHFRAELVPA